MKGIMLDKEFGTFRETLIDFLNNICQSSMIKWAGYICDEMNLHNIGLRTIMKNIEIRLDKEFKLSRKRFYHKA